MASQTIFQFAMVAYEMNPLAEYSFVDGNCKELASSYLSKINPSIKDAFADQGDYVFVSHTDSNNTTYLCLCSKSVSPIYRSGFLQDLEVRWVKRYGNSTPTFQPGSKNQEFGSTEIKDLLTQYNDERHRRLALINQNLEQAKDQMAKNMTAAFYRGEQLEVLDKKAEDIMEKGKMFRRDATELLNKLRWQKYRWYVLGALAIIFVLFIIIVIGCGGFTFKKCKKQKDDK